MESLVLAGMGKMLNDDAEVSRGLHLSIQACYTNSTEVLFATMTLYQLRVIERLWGTRKYLVGQLGSASRLQSVLCRLVDR